MKMKLPSYEEVFEDPNSRDSSSKMPEIAEA